MDRSEAWSKTITPAKLAWRVSTAHVNGAADHLAPMCAPVALWWDREAKRREELRTPENLKQLMAAQRVYRQARGHQAAAVGQSKAARKDAPLNPLSAGRRSARAAEKGARAEKRAAEVDLKAARRQYPLSLRGLVARVHAAHAVPAAAASWWLSTPADWATWPAATSAALIAGQVGAVALGRRQVTAEVPDEVSAEERQLMSRLDPAYWVQHAADRGLGGTVSTPPGITQAGIECEIRLDGQWTVKKLRAAADSVRALLGARTELPMLVAAASRGGWAVLRLRTRSAAPDGVIAWTPGDALGVDMVTGDDVDVPLGLRMLIAGTSGAGKSTASRPLLYKASDGPDRVLVIIDLKMVEGRLWDHRARVASTPLDVVRLVDELVEELTERLEVLPKGQATLIPTAERPRITVVVDEGAEVMSSCTKVEIVTGYTDKGAEITEKANALEGLDSIARMGRAACIDLWWMTQSPTYGDGVPRQIAKQLGTRLGLAVESPSEARVVFGESAQEKGWKADELPMPGVAMLRDGKRSPDPIKVRLITDGDVVRMSDQPIWTRHAAPTVVDAPARPALTLVKPPADLDPVEAAVPAPRTPAGLSDTDTAVLRAVQAGAARQKTVVEETGIAKGTVSKAVKRLVEAGHVARAEDGSLTAAAGEVSA